jgi:RNA polymerase sigma factor (sigma-70 family)
MAAADNAASAAQGPVAAVMRSDDQAWNQLIERYQHIIDAVCRRYQLRPEDSADVSQTVWMKAIDNLDRIRDLRAMPGWIKTTAMRAACTVLRSRERLTLVDVSEGNSGDWSPLHPASGSGEVDAQMLHAERRAAVRDGLAELTATHRALLNLLVIDPPISYQQISEQLGMPVGSIGPTRARCFRKLAATPSIRALGLSRGDHPAADAA